MKRLLKLLGLCLLCIIEATFWGCVLWVLDKLLKLFNVPDKIFYKLTSFMLVRAENVMQKLTTYNGELKNMKK